MAQPQSQSHSAVPFPRSHPTHGQMREETSPTRPVHGLNSVPGSPGIQSMWAGANATAYNRDETDYDYDYQVFGSPTPTQMQSPQQAPKPTLPLSGTSPSAAQHPQAQHTAPSQQHSPNPNSEYNAHPHPHQHAQSTPDREQQQQRPSQPHTPLTPPLTPASSANNDASGSSVSSVSSASVGSTPMSASLSMSVGTPTTSPFTLAVPPCTPASPLLYRDRSAGDPASVASPGGGGGDSHRWPQRLALDFGADIDFGAKLSAAAAAASDDRELSISSGYSADESSGSFSMRQLAAELDEVDGSRRLGAAGGPASPNRRGASMERSGRIDSVDDGARFLLAGGVPNDTPSPVLKDTIKKVCGELRGMCTKFQGSHGVLILAFYDPRHLAQAEARLRAPGACQALFGNAASSAGGLSVQKVGMRDLNKLLGDSPFINETEGVLLVLADGNLGGEAIQNILSGFGELRSFSHANLPNKQAYVVEFFDSRKAKQAREALDNRSIFGTSLRIISKHAADEILASAFADAPSLAAAQTQTLSQTQSTTMSPVPGRASQPSSPLSAFSLSQYVADQQHQQQHQQQLDPYDEEFVEIDTTNSSPFHGPRALPLPISPVHAHMHHPHQQHTGGGGAGGGSAHLPLHVGGTRRISTGSVKIPLHQSTSEQDLRRRAAAGAAAASSSSATSTPSYGTLLEALGLDRGSSAGSAGGGARYDPHMRRTSDTFDFESLRRAADSGSGLGMGLGLGLALPAGIASGHGGGRGGDWDRGREDGRGHGGVRPLRARAISESSASPRVVSPGDDPLAQVSSRDRDRERDRIVGGQPMPMPMPIDLQDAFEDFSSEASGGNHQQHQHQQYSGGPPSTPDGSGGGDLFDSSEEIDLTRIHRRYASAADSSPVTGPQSPHTPHTPGDALAANSIFGSMHSPYSISGWQGQHQHQQAYSPHAHSHAHAHAVGMHGYSPAQTDAHTQALLQAHLMGMPLSVVSPPPSHHHQTQQQQHYYGLSPTSDGSDPYASLHHGYGDGGSAFSPSSASTTSSGGRSATLHRHGQLTHRANLGSNTASSAGGGGSVDSQLAERNQIDLDRIAKGLDTRTTVMIKNIPNKLTDKDLIEYISKVCPRKIDFLYLRMDFQNGCNVGYAFVNFIHVEDLLHFASTKLGVKWNMFSSEKVLQMSYANYQGKEALVEKFKNSCVMDEREAWRPKIFYSSGPRKGLPEPFPAPTHLRRKERSSQNRGALFVPGSPGGSGSSPTSPREASGAGASASLMEGGMLPRGPPFRRPNQHPPNLARHDRY